MTARLVFGGSGSAPGGVTSELDWVREQAALTRSRLALVAIVLGGVALAGFMLRLVALALLEEPTASSGLGARALFLLLTLACCGGMYAYTRSGKGSPATVTTIGLAFEVVIAALIAFPQYGLGAHPTTDPMAPSWLGVWIVVFPLVVPARPTKHLIASLLAASTAPASHLIGSLGGLHPSGHEIGWLTIIAPTGFAVILAHFPARIVHQTQEVVREATQRARSAGSYTLESKIGEGGMGEVWRARHSVLRRPAAVKLIRPEMLSDQQDDEEARIALARFRQEAEVTAQLESPHTIELYDYGTTSDGAYYYVMELLTGLDLEELVERSGPIAPARVIYMMRQVCKSLYEAHVRGLVHRDIKPGNIYCCRIAEEYDVMKVLDFGLVKRQRASGKSQSLGLTGQGFIVGTAVTMSPEQAQGDTLDARSDIYALGCVMYFLLTGRHVFEGGSVVEIVMEHLKTEPTPPSKRVDHIPVDLEAVVLSCLAKAPDGRPQDALGLSMKLAACDLARPWSSVQARRWWTKHLPDKVGGAK